MLQKDLKLEFRSRYAMNAILLFGVSALTAISFSIGPMRLESELLAALLWIMLFFAAMSGLSHIFVREEEQDTADTLRLLLAPNAIWLGKWLFNLCLLFILELVMVPLFMVMLTARIENLGIFLAILISGSIGLATVATIIAAIISLTSSRGALFAVLAFPLALPVLIYAIEGSKLAFQGASFSDCFNDLQVLISFSVVFFTTSLMVFEFVWRK